MKNYAMSFEQRTYYRLLLYRKSGYEGLLRRLKCDNYKVLVAASSIIRPGVAQSGMMKEYIFRHNHPDQFEYFHPVFEEQLGRPMV